MNKNNFTDEKNLISEFQSGEEKAFKFIYGKFFQVLCVFCVRIIKDEPTSNDLVQDSFLKLWENRENFQAVLAIKAFLYTAVRNAALNYLKHQKFTKNNISEINEILSINPEMYSIIKAESERQILDLLEELSPECQKVMKLLSTGKSYKEIADIMHISVNTVKNHRIRGIKILKEKSKNLYFFIYFLFL